MISREKADYLRTCSIPECRRKVYVMRSKCWYGRPLCRRHHKQITRDGVPELRSGATEQSNEIPYKAKRRYWVSLNAWTMRLGDKFTAISICKAGSRYRASYIGVPYTMDDPSIGYTKTVLNISHLRSWERLGWVELQCRLPKLRRYTVRTKGWDGRKLRLPPS